MNAPIQIKDLAAWDNSLGQLAGPVASAASQDALAEMKSLLREIRDLQKAHFDQYKDFTRKILAAERERDHDANRMHLEQLRHQEAVRQAAFQRQIISWIVWAAVLVLSIGGMFLFQLMSTFD